MFARLLKIWLIVSILGYGMALAADVHGELSSSAETHQITADAPDSPDDAVDDSGCNHCAHGTSHMLGLTYVDNMARVDRRAASLGVYTLSWYTFSPPSLLRPPISG